VHYVVEQGSGITNSSYHSGNDKHLKSVITMPSPTNCSRPAKTNKKTRMSSSSASSSNMSNHYYTSDKSNDVNNDSSFEEDNEEDEDEEEQEEHFPVNKDHDVSSDEELLPRNEYEESVRREQNRAVQRELFNIDRGFPFSVDIASSIKRVLKEYIYPKIKILSDREQQFLRPDFVGDAVDQSRRICDILIRELNLPNSIQYKVPFWITYRKLVKNQLVKYRSNCVEEIKKEYFKGKWITYIY